MSDVDKRKRHRIRTRETGEGGSIPRERGRRKRSRKWCGLLMIRQWDDGTMNGIQREESKAISRKSPSGM